jgi:guanylate kinase
MPGSLFIVAAPSGAGKTSLVKGLLEREPGIALSVSHTTRKPRPGEEDGRHYHFVTRDAFMGLVAQNAFLEHADVHGNCYGTSKAAVEPILARGGDVLLEIDFQGARLVREQLPSAVGIFILPPSRAELERRLRGRAQDSPEVIAKRLENSREEIAHVDEFDYVLVNEDFETTLAGLVAIVRSQRLRRVVQAERLAGLIASLRAR